MCLVENVPRNCAEEDEDEEEQQNLPEKQTQESSFWKRISIKMRDKIEKHQKNMK